MRASITRRNGHLSLRKHPRAQGKPDEYRKSLGDEGTTMLGRQWEDKPHRHVYDLCNEVDYLNRKVRKLQAELRKFAK